MIATPARRREAEDLQALLDGQRAGSPATAADLADLVTLARSLTPRSHRPEPGFRADLRARLVAEAAAREPATDRPVPGAPVSPVSPVLSAPPVRPVPRQRATARTRYRQAVAAVTLTAVVAGAGAAAASTRALPGDPLYGLKRSIEQVELTLARGDVGHGRELLEQADARLGEAEALAAGSDSSSPQTRARISQALADMSVAVSAGAGDLVGAYRDTGDEEPMLVLDRAVAEQQERLDDLMQLLDPAQRAQVQDLLHQLAVLGEQTSAVLGPQARALGVPELAGSQASGAASGPGAATAAGAVDKAAAAAAGATGTGGSAVGGVLGAVGSATGGGTSSGGSTSSGSGGVVGGVVGRLTGGTTSSTSTLSPLPVPTATASVSVPLTSSSPLATDPVGTVTSAVPLPTSSARPTVSCVPVPPLTTC